METVLNTSALDVADRFDAYREAVSSTFVPLAPSLVPEAARRPPFTCKIDTHALGLMAVSAVEATPHRIERTRRSAEKADQAYFKVGLQMSGRAVLLQDGREANLAAGDLAVYDTTRPYRIDFLDDYRMLVVMFPRQLLRVSSTAASEGTARVFSGRSGMGALLSPLLTTLETELLNGGGENPHLNDAVLDLVAACFTQGAQPREPGSGRRESLTLTIKSYIEAHLRDPDLDAGHVAEAHHISSSYLQKLFAAESLSVAAYIRQRRLEQCRRELSDPTHQHRAAASIAARWGLRDPSHFSRLFKSAYGITPGEYRATSGYPSVG
ncbi:MAG: helix-turn-helix domain-containing protein [Aeromicrobium sp.]